MLTRDGKQPSCNERMAGADSIPWDGISAAGFACTAIGASTTTRARCTGSAPAADTCASRSLIISAGLGIQVAEGPEPLAADSSDPPGRQLQAAPPEPSHHLSPTARMEVEVEELAEELGSNCGGYGDDQGDEEPKPVTSSTTMTGRSAARSMLPSRLSALSSLVVRSFSTNSRPALRAAACGGRPRPAPRSH
jgi:hypothetical protein